jgi:hypothetical protein
MKNKDMQNLLKDKRSLFNPFLYIAGEKALIAGVFIMTLTATIGYFTNYWQDGLIDLHQGVEASIVFHIILTFSNWLILLIVLTPFAYGLTASKIRFIDLAGTLALARAPMLVAITSGFFPAPQRLAQAFTDGTELSPTDLVATVIIGIIVILMIIWMIALSFNAYKHSANLKGNKAGVSFAIGFILAYIGSKAFAIWYIRLLF